MSSCFKSILLLLVLCDWAPTQCQDHVTLVSGDVMLGVMVGLNSMSTTQQGCGHYDVSAVRGLTAAIWFVGQLNEMDYIPGIKLGLDGYRTCRSKERAVSQTVSVLDNYHLTLQPHNSSLHDHHNLYFNHTLHSSPTPILGLVGPPRTEEAQAVSQFLSSLPWRQRLLQISPSATGQRLADKARYSNFFRVIPPDNTQVQAILKLLIQLHWNYIVIVHDDDDYGQQAADTLRHLAHEHNVCVTLHANLPLDIKGKEFSSTVFNVINEIRRKRVMGVVFLGSSATAREFLSLVSMRINSPRFIFSEAVGLEPSVFEQSGVLLEPGKGSLVTAPPAPTLPEFKLYWNELWTNRTKFLEAAGHNPWLLKTSQQVTGCQDHDDQCWQDRGALKPLTTNSTQGPYDFYLLKAVGVFAMALKRLREEHCVGQDLVQGGLCADLRDVLINRREKIQHLMQTSVFDLQSQFVNVTSAFRGMTSVQFDTEGEVVEAGKGDSRVRDVYDVYNFTQCQHQAYCFVKVGSLTSDNNLHSHTSSTTWTHFPSAQCSGDCPECLPVGLARQILMVPGDLYFVAVVPVHDRDKADPLKCGSIMTTSGADVAQSVLFALRQVNDNITGVFRGSQKLGVILLNSCYRELIIKETVLNLYKGTLQLPDGRNSSAILPYITGYVGAFFSSISVAVYELLSRLNQRFVMVSPANTSPNLSDRQKFPLYLRLPSKDDQQAKALLSIVRTLKAKFVQMVYDPDDNYSAGLKASINRMTASYNVCVVQNIPTSYDNSGRLFWILDSLRMYSWASVVIVVLQLNHVSNFTRDVTTALTPSDHFVFVGSEAWEREQHLLDPVDGRQKQLLGAVTLFEGLPLDQQFDSYFRSLDPHTALNPWLSDFWEARKGCYFEDSFMKEGKVPCIGPSGPADYYGVTSSYQQGLWVPFYINAVKAFAHGVHGALMDKCRSVTFCDQLTSEDLVTYMRGVKMDLRNSGQRERVFSDNGDGDLGFDIYEVQSIGEKLQYVQVGSFHDGKAQMTLTVSHRSPTTTCPYTHACQHCLPADITESQCTDSHQDNKLAITMSIVCLIFIVVIIILAFVIVKRYWTLKSGSTEDSSSLRRLGSLSSREESPDFQQLQPTGEGLRHRFCSHTQSVFTVSGGIGGATGRFHGCKTCGAGGGSGRAMTEANDVYDHIPCSETDVNVNRSQCDFCQRPGLAHHAHPAPTSTHSHPSTSSFVSQPSSPAFHPTHQAPTTPHSTPLAYSNTHPSPLAFPSTSTHPDPLVAHGAHPITQSTHLNAQSAHPISQSTHLNAQSAHPISQSTHPISQSVHPISQSSHPISQSTHPISQSTYLMSPHTDQPMPPALPSKCSCHKTSCMGHSHAGYVARDSAQLARESRTESSDDMEHSGSSDNHLGNHPIVFENGSASSGSWFSVVV